MEQLKRAENGQFDDERGERIKKEFEDLINPFLKKYEEIDLADLSYLCMTTFNWRLTTSKLRQYAKLDQAIAEMEKTK